jgi:hypothetical protein
MSKTEKQTEKINVLQRISNPNGTDIGFFEKVVVLDETGEEIKRDPKGRPLYFEDQFIEKESVTLRDVITAALRVTKEGADAKESFKAFALSKRVWESDEVPMTSEDKQRIIKNLPKTAYDALIIGQVYSILEPNEQM